MLQIGLDFEIIDAFVEESVDGNPAAVVWVSESIDDVQLQRIASEFNLSETAFIFGDLAASTVPLRWFTPTMEIDLCGHATLASAAFIFRRTNGSDTTFMTRSGPLSAMNRRDGIALNFPEIQCRPYDQDVAWAAALGFSHDQFFWAGLDVLILGPSHDWVRGFDPASIDLVSGTNRGIIVTAPGFDRYDCVSRVFAPKVGILEDPVTGSAHCALAPFWQTRLGRDGICAFQMSARGGVVLASAKHGRVELCGYTKRRAVGKVFL